MPAIENDAHVRGLGPECVQELAQVGQPVTNGQSPPCPERRDADDLQAEPDAERLQHAAPWHRAARGASLRPGAWSAPGPVKAGVSGRTQVPVLRRPSWAAASASRGSRAGLAGRSRHPAATGRGSGSAPPRRPQIVHPPPQAAGIFSGVEQVADEEVDPGEPALGGQVDRLGGREVEADGPRVEASEHTSSFVDTRCGSPRHHPRGRARHRRLPATKRLRRLRGHTKDARRRVGPEPRPSGATW